MAKKAPPHVVSERNGEDGSGTKLFSGRGGESPVERVPIEIINNLSIQLLNLDQSLRTFV